MERCLAEASERYGRLDGVVNCAASLFLKPAHAAWLKMTGYGRDEIANQTPRMLQGKHTDRAVVRFITGGNEAKQKIAMTTPVLMSGKDANATMAFVMPAERPSCAAMK